MRTSGKTNSTPGSPNLHRTDPGREKHIKRGAKVSPLSPARWGTLLFDMPSRLEDGFSCYLLNKIAVTLIYLRAIARSVRDLRAMTRSVQAQRAGHAEGGLMSIPPNLCCDETKAEEHTLA